MAFTGTTVVGRMVLRVWRPGSGRSRKLFENDGSKQLERNTQAKVERLSGPQLLYPVLLPSESSPMVRSNYSCLWSGLWDRSCAKTVIINVVVANAAASSERSAWAAGSHGRCGKSAAGGESLRRLSPRSDANVFSRPASANARRHRRLHLRCIGVCRFNQTKGLKSKRRRGSFPKLQPGPRKSLKKGSGSQSRSSKQEHQKQRIIEVTAVRSKANC